MFLSYMIVEYTHLICSEIYFSLTSDFIERKKMIINGYFGKL